MVSIIIPNFNGIQHLKGCLLSLKEQTFRDFKIIIVDNGSSDGSVEFVRSSYPEIIIYSFKNNTGFSVAVNTGIKIALRDSSTCHVLLLNNDIECEPDFLGELLNSFADPRTGSSMPKMLNFYNRNVIDDTGNFIKVYGYPYSRGYGQVDNGQFDKPQLVFGPCAGAALYKKEVFEKVGLFDEDFFAYFEDVDFSFRMRWMGYNCFYNPNSVCFHKRGTTLPKANNFFVFLNERNLYFMRLKNYPLGWLLLYSPVFMVTRVIRWFKFCFKHSPSYSYSALKGFLYALKSLRKTLKKRKIIMNSKTVTSSYIGKFIQNAVDV